jgi:hypothetical protein
MARGYSVGNVPPQVAWTIVRGDTSAFKVYVTDDSKSALTIDDWTISMKIKRPNLAKNLGVITDDATLVLTLTPAPDDNDLAGEFTVSLTSSQSNQLQTGDIFDIQLSQPGTVWTVAQGKLVVIEDVTD